VEYNEERPTDAPASEDTMMKANRTRLTRKTATSDGAPAEYYVLGGEHLGTSIARRLGAAGYAVTLVDETQDSTELPGPRGSPSDVQILEAAGVSERSTVVVATAQDRRNLLIAQLVRVHFDVAETFVLVNAPERSDLVAAAGHEPICVTTILSDAVVDDLRSRRLESGERA
jgi:trk system potassium uptake protein TrkA